MRSCSTFHRHASPACPSLRNSFDPDSSSSPIECRRTTELYRCMSTSAISSARATGKYFRYQSLKWPTWWGKGRSTYIVRAGTHSEGRTRLVPSLIGWRVSAFHVGRVNDKFLFLFFFLNFFAELFGIVNNFRTLFCRFKVEVKTLTNKLERLTCLHDFLSKPIPAFFNAIFFFLTVVISQTCAQFL